jgi:N,N'-diacetylchitobiose transport system substrate-binding protein
MTSTILREMVLMTPWKTRTVALIAGSVVALALAGCAGGGGTKSSSNSQDEAATINVWYMKGELNDAMQTELTADFKAAHPKADIKYVEQGWDGIQSKTLTALASDQSPDVLEFGNTLTPTFAPGLADLTSSVPDTNWVPGMAKSGNIDGKVYGVPYGGGTRLVLYNKKMFAGAGISAAPTSREEFVAAGQRLMAKYGSDKNFSAFYFPGKYWYGALPFIWDAGGDLAKNDGGKWTGTLDSAESVQGLTELKDLAGQLSRAPKDIDEVDEYKVLASGKAAMIFDFTWQIGSIEKQAPALKGQIGVFALPSKTAGKAAPVFLGGSNLGVSKASKHSALATDFVKLWANQKYAADVASKLGMIPNNTTLLATAPDAMTGEMYKSAATGQSVPASKNWGGVEQSNVLQDMLVNIFTGKKSVQDAAKAASAAITEQLNKS